MSGPKLPDGFTLLRLDETDSTNDEAKRLATEGAAEGTVVWARVQRAGRGRRGRFWVSEPGNLFVSIILRPGCGPLEGAQLSFAAALAVAELLDPYLPEGTELRCKWPNDILVDGRKISGILLESSSSSDSAGRLEWLVVGVGVNLAHHPGIGGPHPSTSLSDEGGAALTAEESFERLIAAFSHWHALWRAEGFTPIRTAWLKRAYGVGRRVTALREGASLVGAFTGLDDDGALLLEQAGGKVHRVAAGDVTFAEGD